VDTGLVVAGIDRVSRIVVGEATEWGAPGRTAVGVAAGAFILRVDRIAAKDTSQAAIEKAFLGPKLAAGQVADPTAMEAAVNQVAVVEVVHKVATGQSKAVAATDQGTTVAAATDQGKAVAAATGQGKAVAAVTGQGKAAGQVNRTTDWVPSDWDSFVKLAVVASLAIE
jgi:hypothetical protein